VSHAAGRVFIKFCLLYSGPYLISERPYPNVYTLSDPTIDTVKGKYNIVNYAQLEALPKKKTIQNSSLCDALSKLIFTGALALVGRVT
jgi:hypothetical protein